ncbi:hypothetical protein TNCV_1039971 [Trichonephila clavipes]|nr:hypothetical protein TNCV_1039971 [Trichonephila clavipes]
MTSETQIIARIINSQTGIGKRIGGIPELTTDTMTLVDSRGNPADLEVKVLVVTSSMGGFVNGILETGGVMDKCVQMWTRNYGALGQTARVCFGVLCANRKKEEVKRDFGDLRIRRSEGRVVNTPLVFKGVLFQETKRRPEKKKSEREKEEKRARKREGLIVGGRGEENSRVLFRDADQESKTRMRNNALRTGPRQAVE